MSNIQLIKSRINCVDVAKRLGLPINNPGDRCVSPMGGTNPTQFIVYEDRFVDFKYGVSGDCIDLLAYVKYNGDLGAAIKELAALTGVTDTEQYGLWKQNVQNACNMAQYWHEQLFLPQNSAILNYLHERRITDNTIKSFKIGYDTKSKRITFPFFKNGYVCNYVARATQPDQQPKYLKPARNSDNLFIDPTAPWGLNTLSLDKPIVICEGVFDALSFVQSGFSVLSPMGGFFSREQLATLFTHARSHKNQLYLCFDTDEAGQSFTLKLAQQLFKNKIDFSIFTLPEPYKDPSEAYVAGVNLSTLPTTPGLTYLAQHHNTPEAFSQLARNAARFLDKPRLSMLFAEAPNTIPKPFLNELKKSCFAAPPDHVIESEVLSEHMLKYHESIGFFEYRNTHWERVPDNLIKKYISDALGMHRTGNKVNSVFTLIKSATITTELFNQKPIMNFINGTLDLSDFTFREHSPADLCTFCLPYPYDPEARSPEFIQFINDITDNDPYRAALLQEAAGYVLFTTNELQKCFCLIGNASNGKSVFLNILTKIFGEENVSNVEMSAMGQPFQAIHLMHSLLNISGETKTNIEGSEHTFKQVVTGDLISSSYKGKDIISFRPRAKLFIACNRFVYSKNIDDGFLRRWAFISFPISFVDNPEPGNPLQKKRDTEIESKLTTPQQLSAIFNWVLEGYRILKQTKSFTETRDQAEIMQQFAESLDPLTMFAEDFEHLTENAFRISNNRLYDMYRQWCEEQKFHCLSPMSFHAQFRPHLEKLGWKPYRNTHERGVQKISAIDPTPYWKP